MTDYFWLTLLAMVGMFMTGMAAYWHTRWQHRKYLEAHPEAKQATSKH
jgi:hypothetical protein